MLRSLLRLMCLSALAACARPAPLVAHPRPAAAAAPDWQRFDAAAFAQARREHKLILLSVQADFCHWCHVMNATTYRDAQLLALLRARFITVRVDEAERPDLAARYADWGWPATAILSPDAQGIVTLRGHRPVASLLRLLRQLVAELDAGGVLGARVAPAEAPADADLEQARTRALAQLDALYDPAQGGWGTPQKYPFPAPVEHALLRAHAADEPARLAQALQTLHGHLQLVDPVAGGLFQYSLRGVWSAPHFEKLASSQAGALSNFAEAYRVTGDARWLDAGRSVTGYVLATLRMPDGTFAASQNADVGELGQPGFMEGARYYAQSAAERARGPAPSLDAHVYANLNGALAQGLLAMYRASGDAALLEAARVSLAGLATHGAAFLHQRGEENGRFYLSDQLEVAAALLALADATAEEAPRARAYATMDFVLAELQDSARGGFYAHSADPNAVGVFAEREKPAADNARFARLLLTRAHREGDEKLRALAERALRAQVGPEQIERQGRKVADLLLALEQATGNYVMFSIVGPRDDPRTRALYDAAYRAYVPHGILRLDEPGRSRYPYPDQPAVYLCSESACSSPALTPEELTGSLAVFLRQLRQS